MARKRKKKKAGRPKIVIRIEDRSARANSVGLVSQAVLAGVVYGGLAYLAANRPPHSLAGFAARHPAATFDFAAMKAGEVSARLGQRARAQLHRLRDWLSGGEDPTPEGRQLTYKPGSVGRD